MFSVLVNLDTSANEKSKVGIQDVKCCVETEILDSKCRYGKGTGQENVSGKYSTGVISESQDP